MQTRAALMLVCFLFALLHAEIAAAVPRYDHAICTRTRIDLDALAACLVGLAGPLDEAERDALLASLRSRVADGTDSGIERALRMSVLATDAQSRAVVAELLVAQRILPAGSEPLVLALDQAQARMRSALTARGGIARRIDPESCMLVPADSSERSLAFLCETRIGCGRDCTDKLASATLHFTVRGFRVARAGTSSRPTLGSCGTCF